MTAIADPATSETIELRLGPVVCRVAPGLGGALLALAIDGAQVLRPTPESAAVAVDTACFPLIPFANRIAGGRFLFDGREIQLPADPAAPPHALHGHGWRERWDVAARSPSTLELTYLHPAGAWPWTYRAFQRLTVQRDGLAIEMAVENLSDDPMPCGFGLHPYFALEPESYIEVSARARLLPDRQGIPNIASACSGSRRDLATLPPSDELLLDVSGRARIGSADWEIEIRAEEAIGWQFYLPPERDFFCLEPVSHRPDSFNRDEPLDAISPGECRRWPVSLRRTR